MKSTYYSRAIILWLFLGLATSSSGAEPGSAQRAWERYQVLVERNIFSRDRGSPPPRSREVTPLPPPPPERYLVLTGIARHGEKHMAFLEDIGTGVTTIIQIGDTVLQGRIKNITLDSIEYEKNDRTAIIGIGGDLEGGSPSTISAALPLSETAGSDLTPVAGSAEADILERLRQKREKELGK